MSFPQHIARRLRLPVIAAPMLRVSGPDLVIAACVNGVVGAFPTANARSLEELDSWLTRMTREIGKDGAPWCPNLIMRRPNLKEELAVVLKHRPEMVITSVGSPAPVIAPLHDAGCLVFADVASLHHVERAAAAGVDGIILLTAGAGGQTGWLNPFAFVRAAREMFSGPIVLAGGISDGVALKAAMTLGCDLAYMGTKFIAASESMAAEAYREMLVSSSADDVLLTKAVTGLQTNMLRPSLIAAGLDVDNLDESISEARATEKFSGAAPAARRWTEFWSAGHSVSGVRRISTAKELIDETIAEFNGAASPAG